MGNGCADRVEGRIRGPVGDEREDQDAGHRDERDAHQLVEPAIAGGRESDLEWLHGFLTKRTRNSDRPFRPFSQIRCGPPHLRGTAFLNGKAASVVVTHVHPCENSRANGPRAVTPEQLSLSQSTGVGIEGKRRPESILPRCLPHGRLRLRRALLGSFPLVAHGRLVGTGRHWIFHYPAKPAQRRSSSQVYPIRSLPKLWCGSWWTRWKPAL